MHRMGTKLPGLSRRAQSLCLPCRRPPDLPDLALCGHHHAISIPQHTLLSHLPSLIFPITSIVIQEGFTGVIHRQVIAPCKHALTCQRRTILIFISSSQSRA